MTKKKKRSLSDIDGDGVPNIKDCDMHDKDKQDYNPNVRTVSVFKPKKNPLTLYKGIPVEKYIYDVHLNKYIAPASAKKRAKKRRPKWNKKQKWVKGV
jgi:hypothetical protein